MAGYHGAANVVDDDSLGSITQSIANMQMANNVNVQVLNKNISTITAETRDLCSTLAAAQQQIAALLVSQRMAAPPTPVTVYIPIPTPAYTPPPPPAYATPPPVAYATAAVPTYVPAPPAAVPTYIPVQPSPYQGQGRGRRGRSRGGYGRGSKRSMAFAPQLPAAPYNPGRVPPPAQTQEYAPNPYKRFNNWNMCFTCGFDVPHWHTSATCPFKDKVGHQVGYTRENAESYKTAGHFVSQKAKHKTMLPTTPRPGFE